MRAPVIDHRFHNRHHAAGLNRTILHGAGVLTFGIIGGPGCGKTTLITSTIDRLAPDVRVGVITCDIACDRDADRISFVSPQVVQVNTQEARCSIDANDIRDALDWLDLKSLDLLLIKHVGNLTQPPPDVGQDMLVTMFSVAGGHDKAGKHPQLLQAADLVILNKLDLRHTVHFDLMAFRRDIARIKPGCDLIELSALKPDGMEPWLNWLRTHTVG